MTLLLPLGLLGLLGIAVLILIYILKPNYQQKIVSSTHVWILSLKYKRKRIPINILRSLLLLICQILVITACAMILSWPVIRAEVAANVTEKIAVIDASAGMRASHDGVTRFQRAVSMTKDMADELLDGGGAVTVILAGEEAEYVAQRYTSAQKAALDEALDGLAEDSSGCTYGKADVAGAMTLAADVLAANPEAEVFFYTGTSYLDEGNVNVVSVAEEGEWNACILDAKVEMDENNYVFTAEVACYGQNLDVLVTLELTGVKAYGIVGDTMRMTFAARCEDDQSVFVEFNTANSIEGPIWSYNTARFSIDEPDGFPVDNTFYLYGGVKPDLRIQYASSRPNPFFSGIGMGYRDILRDKYTIDFDEVRKGSPALEGYDFYIFEHTMPETIPTDGVVMLVDPDRLPEELGVELDENITTGDFELAAGVTHPVTQLVDPASIRSTSYRRILSADDSYTPLLYCGGDPVLLVKNDMNEKIVILDIDVHFSYASITHEFTILMYNIFTYYFPTTFTDTVYNVGDTVSLNARGPVLSVSGGDGLEERAEVFPYDLKLDFPGTYTFSQELISGDPLVENIFVRIDPSESNIFREEERLQRLEKSDSAEDNDTDLLLYFAAALVALLFAEWLLQSFE